MADDAASVRNIPLGHPLSFLPLTRATNQRTMPFRNSHNSTSARITKSMRIHYQQCQAGMLRVRKGSCKRRITTMTSRWEDWNRRRRCWLTKRLRQIPATQRWILRYHTTKTVPSTMEISASPMVKDRAIMHQTPIRPTHRHQSVRIMRRAQFMADRRRGPFIIHSHTMHSLRAFCRQAGSQGRRSKKSFEITTFASAKVDAMISAVPPWERKMRGSNE